MAFISAKASAVVSGGSSNSGGYLSASKLGDGDSMRIAIVSPEPLEFWVSWGETEEGTKKPFRFVSEPSPSDLESEMGEFKPRLNFEGTDVEKPKFAISLFVFDYQDQKIKVLEIGQKTIIKEVDKISQTEDYQDIHAWDFVISRTGTKMSTEYRIMPAPRKKGFDSKIQKAWEDAIEAGYDIQQLLVGGSPFGESK